MSFDLSLFSELMVGGTAILLLGIYDDIRGAGFRTKLAVQILVSLVMLGFGYRIEVVSLPGGGELALGVLSGPLTLVWILAIINGLNLIDGVDGLATGVAFISSLSALVLSLLFGNEPAAVFYAILAGVTLGFLRYNFNPASIFLGDSGSMVLGFLLATLSIKSCQKSPTAVAIFIPILILGLPILDTGLSFVRRYLRASGLVSDAGRLSLRNLRLLRVGPAFRPDREHIHHRLLGAGIAPREVTLLLYLVCVGLAVMAFLVAFTSERAVIVLAIYGAVVLFAGMNRLGYFGGLGRYQGTLADSLRAPWVREGARILVIHRSDAEAFRPLLVEAEKLGHEVTLVTQERAAECRGQHYHLVVSEHGGEGWMASFVDKVRESFHHSVHLVAAAAGAPVPGEVRFHDGVYDLIDLGSRPGALALALQRAIEKACIVSRLKFFYGLLWLLGIMAPILVAVVASLARTVLVR